MSKNSSSFGRGADKINSEGINQGGTGIKNIDLQDIRNKTDVERLTGEEARSMLKLIVTQHKHKLDDDTGDYEENVDRPREQTGLDAYIWWRTFLCATMKAPNDHESMGEELYSRLLEEVQTLAAETLQSRAFWNNVRVQLRIEDEEIYKDTLLTDRNDETEEDAWGSYGHGLDNFMQRGRNIIEGGDMRAAFEKRKWRWKYI